ncbi:MAG TPA: hypothetical protein VGB15_16000 [Longimicrobium sp.]|jgi:hypothetical protein
MRLYFMLQAPGGRYVRVAQEGGMVLRADLPDAAGADVFEMEQLDGGVVTLKPIAVDRFVCAEEGGGRELVANRSAVGQWERFHASLADPEGGPGEKPGAGGEAVPRLLVLRAHGGQFVTVAGDMLAAVAPSAGPGETFTVHPVDALFEALGKMENCCGTAEPHDTRRVMWDDQTHLWVLDSAIAVLTHHRAALPDAANLLELWGVARFKDGVKEGLHDADYKAEYKGFLGRTFSSHFCDPDTGKNFLNFQSATALTEVQRFSAGAALLAGSVLTDRRGRRPVSDDRYFAAGYQLGLALHYFTDLTQPMHAANFANIVPMGRLDDWRHSGFETYAENVKKGTDAASRAKVAEWTVKPAEVNPAEFSGDLRFASPTDAGRAAGRYAKGVFNSHVSKLVNDKVTVEHDLLGKPYLKIDNDFGPECDPALKLALPAGQKYTAAFLVTWSRTLFVFDVTAYLPVNMQVGNNGVWTMSPTGRDGSWMRGNHYGAGAKVARCEPNGFRFEGTLQLLLSSKAYFGIEACDFGANGRCRLRLAPGGADSWQEYDVTYKLDPVGNTIEYQGSGLTVRQTSFTAAGWWPGVQFRVEKDGQVAHVCFEDSSL